MDAHQNHHSPNYNHGQAIVELALILPVILLLMFAVGELTRVFYTRNVLYNAAREGARYLAFNPWDLSSAYSNTKAAVAFEAMNSGVSIAPADIVIACTDANGNNECDSGTAVQVSVSTQMNFGVFESMFAAPVLVSSVQMIVP
jgi:Flp pilus assembly protein TadG